MINKITKEIEDIIKTPTVLMCKNGMPIEYVNSNPLRKIKKRDVKKVSVFLASYVCEKGGDIDSIKRFSSGDFNRFLSMSNIYV